MTTTEDCLPFVARTMVSEKPSREQRKAGPRASMRIWLGGGSVGKSFRHEASKDGRLIWTPMVWPSSSSHPQIESLVISLVCKSRHSISHSTTSISPPGTHTQQLQGIQGIDQQTSHPIRPLVLVYPPALTLAWPSTAKRRDSKFFRIVMTIAGLSRPPTATTCGSTPPFKPSTPSLTLRWRGQSFHFPPAVAPPVDPLTAPLRRLGP
ncbi:uncharacterized protein B0T23DRAFT_415073 [Neurospora hispaniola]|uniref:Uncharacterized protein n=1 Tax=Neurospora hispaniola TaxID=588809 RepID=A0AAJ0MP14_9PEZI|nr:hypothetical protein B0T23DRAFT_415073 [Neurospora hispaniola]